MDQSRHRKMMAILSEVKSASADDRNAVLARFCEDDAEMRAEVVQMLDVKRPAPTTDVGMETNDVPTNTPVIVPREDWSGRTVGDYELISELGKGGMGVVYRARQLSLDRMVALKVIRGDRDTGNLSERFRQEAEAVAALDHPNIVPIYEIRENDELLCFSMKLVEGDSLDKRLAAEGFGLREGVTLLVSVARAVHFSHQNGILHRDLKPGNILIDHEGTPFVTDFGLAKQLEDDVSMTQTGQILGTPAYMSPEQAGADRHLVMTTSDVYSLGAILYEVITGRPAVDAKSILEAIQKVTECEPPKPRSVNPKIDKDLEQICLKSLRKLPQDRYASADGLAGDLQSWLNGEPVQARPLTTHEKFSRWCRRRPSVAASWAVLVVFVAASLAIITWKWRQAERQTEIANAANVETGRAKRAADDERARAEEHFAIARDAVSQFIMQIEDDRRLEQAGLHDVRIKLLESAIPFFERLIKRAPGNESAEADRAEAHLRLAQIQSVTGQDAPALENLCEAVDGFRELVAQFPEATRHRQNLAGACGELAKLYQRRGDYALSREMFDESVNLQQALLAESPEDPERRHVLAQILNNLAGLLRDQGQTDEALHKFEQAVRIHGQLIDEDPGVPEYAVDLAAHYFNLGGILQQRGDSQLAKEHYGQVVELCRRLKQTFPDNPELQRSEYLADGLLAAMHFELNEFDLAREHYKSTISLNAATVDRFPRFAEYKVDLAQNHGYWAIAQRRLGDPKSSAIEFEASNQIYRQLCEQFPKVKSYHRSLAGGLGQLSSTLVSLGEVTQAVAEYEKAIELWKTIVDEDPANLDDAVRLAGSQCNLGIALRKLSRLDESVACLDEAIHTLEQVRQSSATHQRAELYLKNSLCNRAITHEMLSSYAEAVNDWQRASGLDDKPKLIQKRLALATSIMLAQQAHVEEAAKNIEASLVTTNQDPLVLCTAAIVYCYCSQAVEEDARVTSFLDTAMECLNRCRQSGYLSTSIMRTQLRSSDAFEPLRQRKDFQRLINAL